MLAIEFEADIHDGVIEIPKRYRNQLGQHIRVIALTDEKIEAEKDSVQYSDAYIEKHWRELIVQGLSDYDESYFKSEQYMLDRGKEGMEKHA